MVRKIFLMAALLISLGGLGTNITAASSHSKTTYQDTSAWVTYDDWDGEIDSGASGGMYRNSESYNESASFTFTGTSITWVTQTSNFGGIAAVTIDGANKGTFDLFAVNAQQNVKHTFGGLSNAQHTIVIQNTEDANSWSLGNDVAIDSFIVGGTTTQDTALAIKYDSWKGSSDTHASSGSYRISGTKDAWVFMDFKGKSVQWTTALGPSYGKAEVFVDGVSRGVVDLYAPTQQWQVTKKYGGLASGYHDIGIRVLGQKNASSSGKKVVLDALAVTP